MRIEKEEGESLRAEIGPARNRCEGGHVGAGLSLRVRHQMAARTPAPGEIGAVIGISGKSNGRIEARDCREQQPNSSHNCAHLITCMNSLADCKLSHSTILEIARGRCGRRSTAAAYGPNDRNDVTARAASPGRGAPYHGSPDQAFSWQGYRYFGTRASPMLHGPFIVAGMETC